MSSFKYDPRQKRSPRGNPAFKTQGLSAVCAALALCFTASAIAEDPETGNGDAVMLRFTAADDGGYAFDTGVLTGRLNAGGRALGLTGVVHQPTGRRLAAGLGLMHPYRIFSGNQRFGDGARDWNTTSTITADGAVQVRWEPPFEVPFVLRAVYRWHDPTTLDVHFDVQANEDLATFEIFLASYFEAGFADPYVYVQDPEQGPTFLLGERARGHWLMTPRDEGAVTLIRDGRWETHPHPVDWTLLPPLVQPVALRRDRHSDLVAVVMASRADCFAVSTPYAGETHYSLYLSLLGHDVPAGERAQSQARLKIASGWDAQDVSRLLPQTP